jgi:hypothetical protein
MKTSLDLPEPLIRELQRRAQQSGLDLTQAVAELLWRGLAASPSASESPKQAKIGADPHTGLPVVECSHAALPATEMTPARVADLLLEQEARAQCVRA